MASAGVGSAGHLVGELFKMMAGVDFVHVPYRGVEAVQTHPQIVPAVSGKPLSRRLICLS